MGAFAKVDQEDVPSGMASEFKNYVIMGDASRKALDIYHLIFAPTYACNLRCSHCYLPDHAVKFIPKEQAMLLLEDWTQIVVAERGKFGGIFHLKGGEPFALCYLTDIIERIAADESLILMMTTNGTIRSDRVYAALRHCNQALQRRVIINVSLDGAREETHSLLRGEGSFNKTLRFIQQMHSIGIIVHINSVIHKYNLDDISDLVSFALREGVAQVNFLPFVPKGYARDIWGWQADPLDIYLRIASVYAHGDERTKRLLSGTYSDILRREAAGVQTSNECVGGYRGLLYVIPNGDVYSCPNLVDDSLRVGNINFTRLAELHQQMSATVYPKTTDCAACARRYVCKGEALLSGAPNDVRTRQERLRELQSFLMTHSSDAVPPTLRDGVSYCFSRNL